MVLVYLQSNDTERCRMNKKSTWAVGFALLWRHNERDGVWNYRRFDCLLNRLFRRRSKKTSKLRTTAFCEGNSPMTGEFPAQRASNAENFIARRHGHVFRMALHNKGDWRMETWQRARRASCHVSIRQSPSCVMLFWTHAKCLLAFISYLSMWIKAKYTFIKTIYSPRFYGGPYMQAKHADICSGVLFWTACTRRSHVLSLPSRCEKSDSWRQARSVKTAKKIMNGTTMWSCDTELCTNGVEATKCWVFVAHFSIYSTSRCRCHAGTDIPRLRRYTLQISQVVRTVRHRISCCAPTIH